MLASILLVTGVIAVKIAAQAYHLTSVFLTRGFTCVEISAPGMDIFAIVGESKLENIVLTIAAHHQEINSAFLMNMTVMEMLKIQHVRELKLSLNPSPVMERVPIMTTLLILVEITSLANLNVH